MKLALIALLLANVLAFAWVKDWLGMAGNREGGLGAHSQEIAPDRLVVIPLHRLAPEAPSERAPQRVQ